MSIDYHHNGVKLRRLLEKDLKDLYDWRNDDRIWQWCRQDDLLEWGSHEKWFWRQAEDRRTSMYGITMSGSLVGVCGLTDIDQLARRAEFSLYVDPERQGQGVGKKALQQLFTHGFQSLGLNLIWGETFDGNPAAHLFEKLGMKLEGVRRAFYFKRGKHIDAKLYSILASEWVV
jgi:RimJ/RimL family protein N-acetyltransferase